MQKNKIQIVWFKRDLRITDHRPIFEASINAIPTLPIYIVETDYWKQPYASKRHWSFIHDSLKDLRKDLKNIGQSLIVRSGSVKNIFNMVSKLNCDLYTHVIDWDNFKLLQKTFYRCPLIPGVSRYIEKIFQSDLELVILTGGNEDEVQKYLANVGLLNKFKRVLGRRDFFEF